MCLDEFIEIFKYSELLQLNYISEKDLCVAFCLSMMVILLKNIRLKLMNTNQIEFIKCRISNFLRHWQEFQIN